MIFAVNLILTSFWPTSDSNETELEAPDVQLTCLSPVEFNGKELENASPKPSAADKVRALNWALEILLS